MSAASWIKRPRPRPDARARLFCVPHAGAGPSYFARWVTEAPPDIEICLVHLPGREARLSELPLDDLTAIAGRVAEEAGPLLDLPFAFLGHSMGAVIAYEAVYRLPAEPRRLFASASPPPHRLIEEPAISHLPDADFLAEVRRAYEGIPDAIWNDAQMMRVMLPSMRADFAAYETYEWTERPPLNCPITALGGSDDVLVPADSIARWAELTSGDCETRIFDGGHFYLTAERDVVQRLVAAALGPTPEARQSLSTGVER